MRYLTLLFLAFPSLVQAAMTAEEFEYYVAGKTLTYFDRGVAYGVEEYLPNHQVRWSYVGDECHDGFWYEAEGLICFVYDYSPDAPQCWVFEESGGRLSARFSDPAGMEFYEAELSDEPLICPGPDVGV